MKKNYILEAKLNKLTDRANCPNCLAYQADAGKPRGEHFQNCASWCKYKDRIRKVYIEKVHAWQDWDNYDINVYAKIVFDAFSEEKPKLVFIGTRDELDWTDAFGTDFDKLDPRFRGNLTALVEDDGGGYEFADEVINRPQ